MLSDTSTYNYGLHVRRLFLASGPDVCLSFPLRSFFSLRHLLCRAFMGMGIVDSPDVWLSDSSVKTELAAHRLPPSSPQWVVGSEHSTTGISKREAETGR